MDGSIFTSSEMAPSIDFFCSPFSLYLRVAFANSEGWRPLTFFMNPLLTSWSRKKFAVIFGAIVISLVSMVPSGRTMSLANWL